MGKDEKKPGKRAGPITSTKPDPSVRVTLKKRADPRKKKHQT